jgi:TRAP-type C4-dicarboxylate transport system substrate-binding protein
MVSLVASISSCTSPGGGDKAGAPAEPIVLRMAFPSISDADPGQPLDRFAQRLLSLSGGTMRIQFFYGWGNFQPDNEQQVVGAVASGRVDLGQVGARVFDSMGVNSFDGLLAPMLIDSSALQDAVLRSDIPRHMLDDLATLGVTGLAMANGGLRRPFSEGLPLLRPVDWRGIGFGTARSRIQEETIAALGATPVEAVDVYAENALLEGRVTSYASALDGYVNHTAAAGPVRFGTANVVLWPGFAVVFANSDTLASLDDQQRAWLEQAAQGWTAEFAEGRVDDEAALRDSCAEGARFADASPVELAAVRRAFSPVYESIEHDATTAAYIREIQDLKRATPAPEITIPGDCLWRPDG